MKIGDLIAVEWIDDETLSTNRRTKSVGWVMGLDPLELASHKYVTADGVAGECITIPNVWSWRLLERLELPEAEKPDFLQDFEVIPVTLPGIDHGYRFGDEVYVSVDGRWFQVV